MVANGSKSRKPSAANSPSKPHDPIVLFLDRNLGKKTIAAALHQAGATVQVHDDHFPPNARDEEWLSEVGRRGWVILTKDTRIRYREIERMALMNAGVRAFVLTAKNLQGSEMASVFVKALPAIRRFAARHAPPFIAKVTQSGIISTLMSGPATRRLR
jgi:predicted nuclease of predicted toxin-antitoxin system